MEMNVKLRLVGGPSVVIQQVHAPRSEHVSLLRGDTASRRKQWATQVLVEFEQICHVTFGDHQNVARSHR